MSVRFMGFACRWTEMSLSDTALYPSIHLVACLFMMNATPFLLSLSCPAYKTMKLSICTCPQLLHLISLTPRSLSPILSISAITTSNFPLFILLTFHVPILCLSVRCIVHATPLKASGTGLPFDGFGLMLSFIPTVHWATASSPVALWVSSDLGDPSLDTMLSPVCFPFMILKFSRQKYWNGLPLPFSVQSQLTRDDCQPLTSTKRFLCLPMEAQDCYWQMCQVPSSSTTNLLPLAWP